MARKRKRSRKTPLMAEIASAGSRELYESFFGDSIQNPDKVIQKRSNGLGLALYDDMEDKDGHIASVIQTRKQSVIGKEWGVEPASEDAGDEKIAEFVEQVFSELNFDKARFNQLDAFMKGFAVSEIMWEQSEGQIWICEFKHRKPWRFAFGKEDELRFLTEANSIDGEEIDEEKFWVYSFDPRYGNRYGRALGRSLFWPYWFKKNNLKFWALFNDKFGSPTVVGKYRPGAKKEEQEKLLAILKTIQQETGLTVPNDVAVELLEASRRGSIDTYTEFVQWCEETQSKIVLGQTLTTQQGDKGARSLGEVHERVLEDLTKADCDSLCESLNNGPLKRLVDFNFPNLKDYPKLWIKTEKEKDLKPLAERDKIINDMGWKLTEDYIVNTYGVEVEAREELEETQPPSEFAEVDNEDALKPFAARLTEEAAQDKLIEPVQKLLNESESLEEFRDGLLNLYGELDVVDMGEAIQRGLELADALGRFESLPDDAKEDA